MSNNLIALTIISFINLVAGIILCLSERKMQGYISGPNLLAVILSTIPIMNVVFFIVGLLIFMSAIFNEDSRWFEKVDKK